MKIKVTNDEIENSVKEDSHHCMIADALAKAKPNARYIFVDVQCIKWSDLETGKRYVCLTPPKAQMGIIAFDQGDKVEPFEFNLTPAFSMKVGWQANHPNMSRKGRKYNKTGKHIPRPRAKRKFGLRMLS